MNNIFYQMAEQEVDGSPKNNGPAKIFLDLQERSKSEDIEPSFPEEALRQTARTGSNVAAQFFGLPGDLFSLINEYIAAPASELITGQKAVPYEKTPIGRGFPTSAKIKRGHQQSTGGYLSPKTHAEAATDETIEDFTSLFLMGKPGTGLARRVILPLGQAVAGNIAKEGVGYFGGSPSTGELTKIGTMLTMAALTPRQTVNQLKDGLYKQTEALLPDAAKTNAQTLERNLNSYIDMRQKGVATPEKTAALNSAKELLSKIKNGTIEVAELAQAKKDVNRLMVGSSTGQALNPKELKPLYKQLNQITNSALNEYAKINPKYVDSLRKADQVHAVLEESQLVKKFVQKLARDQKFRTNIMLLFAGESVLFGGPKAALGTAAAVTGGALAGQGAMLLKRVMKSPVLREYYGAVLREAAKGNSAAVMKNLQRLDEALANEKRS